MTTKSRFSPPSPLNLPPPRPDDAILPSPNSPVSPSHILNMAFPEDLPEHQGDLPSYEQSVDAGVAGETSERPRFGRWQGWGERYLPGLAWLMMSS